MTDVPPFWQATNAAPPTLPHDPYSGAWSLQAQLIDLAPGDTTTGPTSAAVNVLALYELAEPVEIGSYGFAARSTFGGGGSLDGYGFFGSVDGATWEELDSGGPNASYDLTVPLTLSRAYSFYQLVIHDGFASNILTDYRIYDALGAEIYGTSVIFVPIPTIRAFGLTSGGVSGIAVQGS